MPGVILAEQLLGVTSSKSYALYERTQITELLKEKTFEESDLADKPGAAAKFGRMSGISFLVVGTLKPARWAILSDRPRGRLPERTGWPARTDQR